MGESEDGVPTFIRAWNYNSTKTSEKRILFISWLHKRLSLSRKKTIFHFPKIKSVELFIIKIYFQLLWKYHLHLHTCKWIRIPIVMSILCCCMKDIWQDLFVFTSDYTHGTQGDREVWIVFHHAYSCPYIQEGIPTLVESL